MPKDIHKSIKFAMVPTEKFLTNFSTKFSKNNPTFAPMKSAKQNEKNIQILAQGSDFFCKLAHRTPHTAHRTPHTAHRTPIT
jgi:hypothetical protein